MNDHDKINEELYRFVYMENMISSVQKNVIATLNSIDMANKSLKAMEMIVFPLTEMLLQQEDVSLVKPVAGDKIMNTIHQLTALLEKVLESHREQLTLTGEMMLSNQMLLGNMQKTVKEIQLSTASTLYIVKNQAQQNNQN